MIGRCDSHRRDIDGHPRPGFAGIIQRRRFAGLSSSQWANSPERLILPRFFLHRSAFDLGNTSMIGQEGRYGGKRVASSQIRSDRLLPPRASHANPPGKAGGAHHHHGLPRYPGDNASSAGMGLHRLQFLLDSFSCFELDPFTPIGDTAVRGEFIQESLYAVLSIFELPVFRSIRPASCS